MAYEDANSVVMHSTKLTTACEADSALAAIPKMVDSLATKGDAWWQFLLTHDFGADQRRVKTPAVLIVTGANDQQADLAPGSRDGHELRRGRKTAM